MQPYVREPREALLPEISGDRNPLHDDEAAAKASRFGEIVVQRGVTSAILNAVVGEELPGLGTVSLNVNWSFKAPVRPGDTITGGVEVISVCTESDHRTANYSHSRRRNRRPGRNRAVLHDGYRHRERMAAVCVTQPQAKQPVRAASEELMLPTAAYRCHKHDAPHHRGTAQNRGIVRCHANRFSHASAVDAKRASASWS